MSDSLNAISVWRYFPCSDFLGLLVCDGQYLKKKHANGKINSIADRLLHSWPPNQANVTGLIDLAKPVASGVLKESLLFLCMIDENHYFLASSCTFHDGGISISSFTALYMQAFLFHLKRTHNRYLQPPVQWFISPLYPLLPKMVQQNHNS